MKKLPLLILHGWNLSGSRFRPLQVAFEKKGFTVFAPDLPGFGNAKIPPKPYSLSDYALFVETFLDRHNIKKCIIVGHSFGGRVALIFTQSHPEKVAALILTGTPLFPPVAKLKMKLFLIIAKVGKLFFLIPPLSFFAEISKKFLYRVSGSSDYYRTEGMMRQTFRLVVKEDLLPALQSISIPLLMIWGGNDAITPVWIAQKAHKIKPESQLIIIEGERHMVPVDQPGKFVNGVITFLEAV